MCSYWRNRCAMLCLAPTGFVLAALAMLGMKCSKWLKFVFLLVFGGILLVPQALMVGARWCNLSSWCPFSIAPRRMSCRSAIYFWRHHVFGA
ncbi:MULTISPECIES: hypothetical protein [Paraeggerthella]|uniref:hypothetical protein n=1 Tax=Paraeggerthella TaxID=651554 RepID=UPI0034E1DA6F